MIVLFCFIQRRPNVFGGTKRKQRPLELARWLWCNDLSGLLLGPVALSAVLHDAGSTSHKLRVEQLSTTVIRLEMWLSVYDSHSVKVKPSSWVKNQLMFIREQTEPVPEQRGAAPYMFKWVISYLCEMGTFHYQNK